MTDNTTAPRGAIAKKISRQPPHVQAGIEAYRRALDRREDWHTAVIAAIETSIAVMKDSPLMDGNQTTGMARMLSR